MVSPGSSETSRPRILTGDTPTGRLHIGHYVGSLENRVRMQKDYDCFFLVANLGSDSQLTSGEAGMTIIERVLAGAVAKRLLKPGPAPKPFTA